MPKKCHKYDHPDHTKELGRLNRIAGQVEGLREMIEDRRYCIDILVQLKAVRSAIKSLESQIFKTHLKNCLIEAAKSKSPNQIEDKLEEITMVYKKFDI